ncbi:hypothetical protein ONZ45_g2695 [Pleurotus djamor]|nr:hypothetical protein ONZ45_g2695 [Pleurotus djamor]
MFNKLTLATLALFAASAVAQGTFPDCALSCLDPSSAPDCGPTDNVCLCRAPAFIEATTACIRSGCSAEDAATAEALSRGLCAAVGVTLTSEPAGPTSTAPAPASSSTSSGGSSSSTPSSSSSSTGTTTAPAPAETSNAASFNGVPAYAGIAVFGLAALAL